jgi:hypothetical protein
MADPSNQNLTCSSEKNSRQPATASTSLDARQNTVQIPGTSSSGTIAAPGSQIADDLVNAEGSGQLSKEEADRLYEENIEEEYAKREGGA